MEKRVEYHLAELRRTSEADPVIAMSLHNIWVVYYTRNELDRADKILEQSHETLRMVHGHDSM